MLCISVAPAPGDEGIRILKEAFSVGDAVEIRLDKIRPLKGLQFLKEAPKPLLLTYRTLRQGGAGAELEKVIDLILGSLSSRNIYVDVEYGWPYEVKAAFARCWTQKVILSHHILDQTPGLEELTGLFFEMASTKPFALKIVSYARSIEDNLTIKRFLSLRRMEGTKLISFLMGPLGLISRVLCVKWGSYMSFASLKGQKMADGQIPGSVMRELWEDKDASSS